MVLSYRTIYPENIAQFLIFYRTLSDGLTGKTFSSQFNKREPKQKSAFEITDFPFPSSSLQVFNK